MTDTATRPGQWPTVPRPHGFPDNEAEAAMHLTPDRAHLRWDKRNVRNVMGSG